MMAIADAGEAMPMEMGIKGECKGVRGDDGHRAQMTGRRRTIGRWASEMCPPLNCRWRVWVDLRGLGLDEVSDERAIDQTLFGLCGLLKAEGSHAIDVAGITLAGLVEQCQGVGGEDLTLTAGLGQAVADVGGGPLGSKGPQVQTLGQTGP